MCYFATATKQVGIINQWMRDNIRGFNDGENSETSLEEEILEK